MKFKMPKSLKDVGGFDPLAKYNKTIVDPLGIGVGDAIYGANGGPDYSQYDEEQRAAIEAQRKAYEEFVNGGSGTPLQYQDLDPASLAQLQKSGMADISTDPKLRDAQLEALRQLEEQSETGFTARDEADLAKMRSDVNRTSAGRIGAIKQNMASRGMSGSGMDLVAQMQAEQDATDREALASLEQNAQMNDRKNQATMQRGQMAGSMRSQDFSEEASKAEAQDAINRFNTANMVNTQVQNNQGRNQANQQNWNRDYQFRTDKLGAQNTNAQNGYNWSADQQNRKMMQDQQKQDGFANKFGAILGTAGGVVGGIYGGPAGAAAGAQVGSGVGQGVGRTAYRNNYAHGGRIPGDPMFDYDTELNDTKQINVTPGEIVVPLEASQDPNTAAAFAASAADPFSNIKNPQVREYMRQKMAAQKDLESAQSTQDMLGYGNIAGKAMNDFANAGKQDIILKNRMQDLGKRPEVVEANRPQYDSSVLDKLGAMGVQRAQGKVAQAGRNFDESMKVKGITDADKLNDPNSQESISAREYLKQIAPGVAGSIAGFDRLTAAQVQKTAPGLYQAYNAEQERKARSADRSAAREDAHLNRESAKDDRYAYRQEQRDYAEGQKSKETTEKKKGQVVEVEDRRRNIKDNLAILDKMIEENGTWEVTGSHNQDMERLVDSIATDMAKLSDPSSVARPSEVEQWKKTLVSPGFKNSNETARQILKNFEGEVDRRAENAYAVRGLEKPEAYNPGKNTPTNTPKPSWAK